MIIQLYSSINDQAFSVYSYTDLMHTQSNETHNKLYDVVIKGISINEMRPHNIYCGRHGYRRPLQLHWSISLSSYCNCFLFKRLIEKCCYHRFLSVTLLHCILYWMYLYQCQVC